MTRIEALEAKLAARKDKPEFKENCAAIEAELANLRARLPDETK